VTVYLDASVVLRILSRQPKRLAARGRWEAAYSSLMFATHDPRQLRAARALGFECLGA